MKIITTTIFLFLAIFAYPWEDRTLVIIQTADTHSRFRADTFSGKPCWESLAAGIKKEVKKAGGRENCLLIDCGDLLQGSFSGASTSGEVAALMIDELCYDAWIPGNHDFDFGAQRLQELFRLTKTPEISANIILDGKPLLEPFIIITKNKMKIAVIGFTTPFIDKWQWGDKHSGIKTLPHEKILDELIPRVMESKPDMIILAMHDGMFEQGKGGFGPDKIAERYPQIDIILGAHSHELKPGERAGISSWFVQPGAFCEYFAVIKAELAPAGRKGNAKIESSLVEVLSQEDYQLGGRLKEMLGTVAEKSREPVALMGEAQIKEIPLLIGNAMMETAGTDSFLISIDSRELSQSGILSEADLFQILPYEDTVCAMELAVSQIDELIAVKDDRKDDFTLIYRIGKASSDKGKVRIALSSYLLAGAGGRLQKLRDFAAVNGAKDMNVTVRDALKKYLRKH